MTELTSFEQLDNTENLEKYKAAGTIASKALNKVIKCTNPGVSVLKLCKMGDDFISSEVHTVYKNNKLKNGKGIAFPTCVSRNNYVGFYSPLDDTEKIENGVSKKPLRKILSEYLPSDLFERKKQGFGVPINHWMRAELKEWVNDILSKEVCNKHNFFKYSVIDKIKNEHFNKIANHENKLWSLIQFNSWYLKNF